MRESDMAYVDRFGEVARNGIHPHDYIRQVNDRYTPIVPDDRLVQLARGYVVVKSDSKTRPDMNNERHLLAFARLVVDEARARLPLWEIEQKEARNA